MKKICCITAARFSFPGKAVSMAETKALGLEKCILGICAGSKPTGTKYWWYTHRSLRRVRALVIHAVPDLFHYLDDPPIPKTSNGLEGRFGSLKNHYRQHRGLSKKRREGYLAWYLTVVVNGEKPPRFVL